MATLKVNEITPTTGTDVTIGGNLLCGSGAITTTGNASCGQLTTAGSVAIGGNVDMNSNAFSEVGGISATGTVTSGAITGFGAINGTNATLTGTLTMDGTDDIVMTASNGKIACKSLEVNGVAVSTSAPLKAFGRISVDTAADPHTAVVQTGDLNLGTATITAAGAGTTVVTVPFTEALSGTDYVVMTTTTISDGFALPGTRGTSSFEMTVTDAKSYDIQIMVLSV